MANALLLHICAWRTVILLPRDPVTHGNKYNQILFMWGLPLCICFPFFFTHIILFSWLGHLTVCCLSCGSILLINTVSIYFSIQVLFQFLSLYKSMVYLRCSVRPGIKVINIKSDFKVSIQITLECLLYLLLLSWPTSVSLSLPTYLKSRDSPL